MSGSSLNSYSGIVFNIQKFSIHDGPGIRTVVFLKGCPLNCKWCSNPESQCLNPIILFNPNKCINCNTCIQVCKKGAILDKNDTRIVDVTKCDLCGDCLEVCYSGGLERIGDKMNVEEVMNIVRQDMHFYLESGGGLTLSGGEPSMQYTFASKILDKCIEEGINTALETCGFAQWEKLKELIQKVDLVLYDIKHTNSEVHKTLTGRDNKLILDNARNVAKMSKKMIVRIPVIPTYNSYEDSILSIMEFVLSLKTVREVHLLPYHSYGSNKYKCLGWEYELKDLAAPSNEEMEKLKALGERLGLITQIGG